MAPLSRDSIRQALDGLEGVLWVLLLAGTPLFIVPQAYESFLVPKALWAESLIVLLACSTVVRVLLGGTFRVALCPAVGILVAWGLWHAVSIAWARSPSLAFDDAKFWLLASLAGVLFQSAYWRRPKRLAILAGALIASAVLTALWALSDDAVASFWPYAAHIQNKLGDWRGSIAAGFGNTSHIADFLALVYPLAFLAYWRAERTVGLTLIAAVLWIAYAALIVCFSVHSNTGLIVAMLLTLGLLWRLHGGEGVRRRWARLAVLAAGWMVIALFFSLDVAGNPHRPGVFHQALGSQRLEFGLPSRVFIWETALEMIRQHPWLGVGGGNFEFVFPATHSALVLADPHLAPMAGSWTNAAHNSLLQAWAELGVVGPALLVALFTATAWGLLRGMGRENGAEAHGRVAAVAALAAFAVHAQMNFPLQMAPASMILVMIVGLSAILTPPGDPRMALPDLALEYGWGRFTVELATFRRPGAFRIEMIPAPRAAALVGLIVCLPAAGAELASAGRALASDIVYRQARAAQETATIYSEASGPGAPLSPQAETAFGRADELYRRALGLWPDNQDCRSAYAEMLVRQGRGAEALKQIDRTMQRLNAWELHLRRARALWLLGDLDSARQAARDAFEMKPIEARQYPRAAAWALKGAPAGPGVAAELGVPARQ